MDHVIKQDPLWQLLLHPEPARDGHCGLVYIGAHTKSVHTTLPIRTRLCVERPGEAAVLHQSTKNATTYWTSFAPHLTVLEDKLRCKLKLSCCICSAVDRTEGFPAVDVVGGLT
jgi:hypothetical protein